MSKDNKTFDGVMESWSNAKYKIEKTSESSFLNPILQFSNTPTLLGSASRQSQRTLTTPIEDPAMRGRTWFSRTQ
jgi:hypothetical protein